MKLLPYCPTTNVGTARVVVVELFSRGCVIVSETKGRARTEIRTFGTMTDDLLALADWLATEGVTHVAMESTGVYWKAPFNLCDSGLTSRWATTRTRVYRSVCSGVNWNPSDP